PHTEMRARETPRRPAFSITAASFHSRVPPGVARLDICSHLRSHFRVLRLTSMRPARIRTEPRPEAAVEWIGDSNIATTLGLLADDARFQRSLRSLLGFLYSSCSARDGETREARKAGIQQASNATAARIDGARMKVTPSFGPIPNNMPRTAREA